MHNEDYMCHKGIIKHYAFNSSTVNLNNNLKSAKIFKQLKQD